MGEKNPRYDCHNILPRTPFTLITGNARLCANKRRKITKQGKVIVTHISNPSEPYDDVDWAAYEALVADIIVLDALSLALDRGQTDDPRIIQRLILNGPYRADEISGLMHPGAQDSPAIDIDRINAYRTERLRALMKGIMADLDVMSRRAEKMVQSAESLADLFPEGVFREKHTLMVEEAASLLADMVERVFSIQKIVTLTLSLPPDECFRSYEERLSAAKESLSDTDQCDDPMPIASRVPDLRTACKGVARLAFTHAVLQRDLAEHALACIATDVFIRKIAGDRPVADGGAMRSFALNTLAAAISDVEHVEALLRSVYVSGEICRPVFPGRVYSSSPIPS